MVFIVQRMGGTANTGASGDYVGVIANLAAAGGKFAWYMKGQSTKLGQVLKECGTDFLPTPTAIVDVAMVAVSLVDLLNGFGSPENGASFGSGADKLENANLTLELAGKTGDWSGPAADQYAAANKALQALVVEMKELDRKVQSEVKAYAYQVQLAHNTITYTIFALIAAQGIALLLYLIPFTGPAWSLVFQIGAAMGAALAVLEREIKTLIASVDAFHVAKDRASEYATLAEKATKEGNLTKIAIAEAPATYVSSFENIINASNIFASGNPDSAPTVQTLAGAAGAVSNQAAVEAEEKFGALSEVDTPDVPADAPLPEDGTDSPRWTPPTMEQLTTWSGQVATISANIAQPLNVVNQTMGTVQGTMGSVQQLASMGQQDPAADAAPGGQDEAAEEETRVEPFYEESAPAGSPQTEATAEAAGAASGTETGERAPVDVAAAEAERAAEAGPIQRPL